MQSTDKNWLGKYQHRRLQGLTLIAIGLAQMAEFTADPDVRKDVTGDTIVAAAFSQIKGQSTFVIAVLDQALQPGGQSMPVIDMYDLSDDITDMVSLASFFGTGDGNTYMNFGQSPDKLDPMFVKGVNSFLASREGTYMQPDRKIADVRFVGDTVATLLLKGDDTTLLENAIILGFAPEKNLLVAKLLGDGLAYQSIAQLAKRNIDDKSAWQRVGGIERDDVYRVGRIESDGNELIAPISAHHGGISKNAELVISLATATATVDYNDDEHFVMTTNVVVSDTKPAAKGNDPLGLGLITYGEKNGLGMSHDDGAKGPYQRYRAASAMRQQQLTA